MSLHFCEAVTPPSRKAAYHNNGFVLSCLLFFYFSFSLHRRRRIRRRPCSLVAFSTRRKSYSLCSHPSVDGLEEAEAVFDGHLFDSQHVLTGSFLSFFFVFFFLGSWLDVFSGVVGSTTGFDSLMIGRH